MLYCLIIGFREKHDPDTTSFCHLHQTDSFRGWFWCVQAVWKVLKCHYYAFLNITSHAVCHAAVYEHKLSLLKLWSRQHTINKVIVYKKKIVCSQSSGIQILFCYFTKYYICIIYAVDKSQRTAPSDQSQQWKAGVRETESLLKLLFVVFWPWCM